MILQFFYDLQLLINRRNYQGGFELPKFKEKHKERRSDHREALRDMCEKGLSHYSSKYKSTSAGQNNHHKKEKYIKPRDEDQGYYEEYYGNQVEA